MAENCTHNCSSCGSNCSDRTQEQNSFLASLNDVSSVKKVIGVVSGKGGVGKSLVTAMLASAMEASGEVTAILDADVTGPSIPKIFGNTDRAVQNGDYVEPVTLANGIQAISLNSMLDDETDPVIWRGAMIANLVKQFWTDFIWRGVDYMFVDMPPGTGDVPLTVFQSLPVDGIIIVTSPQDLVTMIVEKAVKMAYRMNVPVLGIVENMSYLKCPDCGKEINVFGESHIDEVAKKFKIDTYAKLPMDPEIAKLCDAGRVYDIDTTPLQKVIDKIKSI